MNKLSKIKGDDIKLCLVEMASLASPLKIPPQQHNIPNEWSGIDIAR
jgi:hypothetical protein